MNRVLAAILFLLLPLAILGQVDTNRDADFQQGNRFYEQKDYANALPYFQRAAEVGNVDAQNNLGVMYHFGEGVSKDFSKAAEWYRKAAEKNHVKAQFNLGVLYQAPSTGIRRLQIRVMPSRKLIWAPYIIMG